MRPTKPCPRRRGGGRRDEAVLQKELGIQDRALAHLLERSTDRESLIALLEHEGGYPFGARAGRDRCKDHVELRRAGARYPALLPAEDIPAVDPRCAGRHRGRIGADARFRARDRAERWLLRGERLDPAAGLLLAPENEDRLREEPVRRDQVSDPRAAPAELLLHERLSERVLEPATAEAVGKHERRQPESRRLVPEIPRHLGIGLVHRRRGRPDPLSGKLAADRLDLTLLRCQLDELGRHWARFSLIRCSARESHSDEISTPQPGPSGTCTRPPTTRGRGSYIPTCHG